MPPLVHKSKQHFHKQGKARQLHRMHWKCQIQGQVKVHPWTAGHSRKYLIPIEKSRRLEEKNYFFKQRAVEFSHALGQKMILCGSQKVIFLLQIRCCTTGQAQLWMIYLQCIRYKILHLNHKHWSALLLWLLLWLLPSHLTLMWGKNS